MLDHDVVGSPASSVHADGNAVLFKHAGIRRTGVLRALIGVEDVGAAASPECQLQGANTEVLVNRYRDLPPA